MNKRLLSAFVAAVVMTIFLAPSLAGGLHTGPRTYHVRAGWDYSTGFGALVAQAFMPSLLFIRAGDTVVWTNEHSVGEPHTASFNFGNVPHPGLEAPFAVSGEIIPLLPPELGGPLVVDSLPTGEPILIGFNERAFLPVDEWGTWVNSGFLLAEDHVEEFPGSTSSWSYTFTEPGTYNYHCVLHHWMTGTIVVLG